MSWTLNKDNKLLRWEAPATVLGPIYISRFTLKEEQQLILLLFCLNLMELLMFVEILELVLHAQKFPTILYYLGWAIENGELRIRTVNK